MKKEDLLLARFATVAIFSLVSLVLGFFIPAYSPIQVFLAFFNFFVCIGGLFDMKRGT